jgi:hypothetical protein
LGAARGVFRSSKLGNPANQLRSLELYPPRLNRGEAQDRPFLARPPRRSAAWPAKTTGQPRGCPGSVSRGAEKGRRHPFLLLQCGRLRIGRESRVDLDAAQ